MPESKEQLNMIIQHCQDKIDEQEEILEILKKHLKVKSLALGIEDIVICCEDEEDFTKIEAWLKKDKGELK